MGIGNFTGVSTFFAVLGVRMPDFELSNRWDEKRKAPAGSLLFLFFVVGIFLGVESRAETELPLADRTLGSGSVIEIMDEIDFGLSREKRYCEGQDTGFFRSLMSNDCCTVRINPLEAPLTAQIVLGKGIRQVREVSEGQRFAVIQGKYEIVLNCGENAPTSRMLQKSMGSRILVHQAVPLSPEPVKLVAVLTSDEQAKGNKGPASAAVSKTEDGRQESEEKTAPAVEEAPLFKIPVVETI